MAENFETDQPQTDAAAPQASEILTNDYGATIDGTVVIEEATRTVLLTENETVVIEKEPRIDIVPKNRPRRIYAGMWGRAETATVALGLLSILAVVILFVLVVLPAQKELEKNRGERDLLEAELTSAKNKYGGITTVEARVAELVNSTSDFESRFLPVAGGGKTALYQRINGLIAAYGLVNTSGPEYAPMEISNNDRRGARQTNESERGRAKFQSLFPGVYVTTTVEGSYQNLRRFIRDIETSEQFVVISAVELSPAEKSDKNEAAAAAQQASITGAKITPMQNQQPDAAPGIPYQTGAMQQPYLTTPTTQAPTATAAKARPPRGKTHGETVSLHLEMAAYFRRPNFVPASTVNP